MANMSYCRFENTLRDLKDCMHALRDGEAENSDLSPHERWAKKELLELVEEMAEEFRV